jgi:exopolysaccharide production protein ExoQ
MAQTSRPTEFEIASPFEVGLAIVVSLVYWTDVLWLVLPGETNNPSPIFRLSMLGIYAVSGLLLARRWDAVIALLKQNVLLVALLLLPLISYLWSIAPAETFNRAIALLGSCAFGLYLASHFSPHRCLLVIAGASCLAAIVSAILIVAFPDLGVMPDGEYIGAWRGAYSHKNSFGFMTSLGAVVCLIAWRATPQPLCYVFGLGLVFNLVLLAGSRSLTAQINVFLSMLIVLTAARSVRLLSSYGIAIALGLALLVITAVGTISAPDIANLLARFGKDLTLSARLPLWDLIIPFAQERFWLGFGYDAFWNEGHYAVDMITQRMRFNPMYSHNGILELWLSLGFLGVVLFVFVFVQFIIRALTLLNKQPDNPIYLFSIVHAFLLIIGNINEATLLQRNSMSWIMFVMLAFILARDRAGSRNAPSILGGMSEPAGPMLPRLRVQ